VLDGRRAVDLEPDAEDVASEPDCRDLQRPDAPAVHDSASGATILGMMRFPYEEFDLSSVRTYPLKSRKSKTRTEDFGRAVGERATVGQFVESLPNMLAAADFRRVIQHIVEARRGEAGVLWGIGAHVVKTGLGPVLIDLMERGFVSAIATNGAAVIHDFEIALAGAT